MSRKWRVAILGLGHWYSAYGLARALPEYPHAELVAVAWHDPAQLDAFTSDLRHRRATPTTTRCSHASASTSSTSRRRFARSTI